MDDKNSVKYRINKDFNGDIVIWSIVILLLTWSLLIIYSSSSSIAYRRMYNSSFYFFSKHLFSVCIGFCVIWITYKMDYRYFASLSKLGLIASFIALIASWRYGVNINGASRWIMIPIIHMSFQPSDLAQMSLLVNLAYFLSNFRREHFKSENNVKMLMWIFFICALISLTKFSKGILLFVSCVMMMFISKYPLKRLFVFFIIISSLILIVALCFGQRRMTIINRIKHHKNNEISYQTCRSFEAVASGGIFGRGPGNSAYRFFLPYSHSDYVFPIIIEEYGIIGGIFIVVLYLLLASRGMLVLKKNNKDAFAKLVAVGLSFNVCMQALINISVTLGLFPSTGIQLPLISMGGTSTIFGCIELGMILNVTKD